MTTLTRLARLAIRWELAILALAAPFLFFPGDGRELALVVLPALWLARWVAYRRFILRTPLDLSLLLLLVMVGVSLWATFDIALSLPKVTGVLLGVAVYYAMVERGASARGVVLALVGFVVVSAAMAGIGLFTTNWIAKLPGLERAISFLPSYVLALPGSPPEGFNPNGIAGALLFSLPPLLLLAWPHPNATLDLAAGRQRGLLYLSALLLCALVGGTLLLTQSRGGYLGLAVGVAALLVLPRRRLLLLSILLGAVLLFTLLQTGAGPLERYFDAPAGQVGNALDSLAVRVEIWSRAIYGMQDFPFTGMGMGTFRRVVPLLYPLFSVSPTLDIGHPHNHLLAAGVDLGIPGLVAYVALWLGAGAMLAQVWRSSLPRGYRLLALGMAAGMLAQFTWGLTDSNVLGAKAGFPFWLALGVIGALHRFAVQDG